MYASTTAERRNDTLRETVLSRRHESGLQVYLCPRPGFHKKYACFATDFGSADSRFRVNGSDWVDVPDGVAHFLEHKLFEEEDGVGAMDKFSALGASSNAYTSFDTTNYLFSCSERFYENLRILVDFVQRPYFTDENVEKEKGIIGEEIGMADDSAGRQLYFNLLEALYHRHPIQKRILGTRETIGTITPELLYECHRAFYHPQNMILFAVGDIEPDAYFKFVDEQLDWFDFTPLNGSRSGGIELAAIDEPPTVDEVRREEHMEISLPRLYLGVKDRGVETRGRELFVREQATSILLDILFGRGSKIYQQLFEAELIDEGFGGSYSMSRGAGYSIIGGETPDPDALDARIREELARVRVEGVDVADFERQKRATMGLVFRQFNSLEYIANYYCAYRFADVDLFDIIDVLHEIDHAFIERRLREHLVDDALAVSILWPNAEKKA